MRFGVYAHTHGGLADVGGLAELASVAAASGWDGFFIWDQLFQEDVPVVDTQVTLGAIGLATRDTNLKIGPLVVPLARRRPWKVARELATLDRLASGRVIAGAGIGDSSDFTVASSEPADLRVRAAVFEDDLEIVKSLLEGDTDWEQTVPQARLITGDPDPVPLSVRMPGAFTPPPGPIPFWGSAVVLRPDDPDQKKKPFRRAAERMDGLFPIVVEDGDYSTDACLTPDEVRRAIEWAEAGTSTGSLPSGFEVVASGRTRIPNSPADLEGLEKAGVTWWLEDLPLNADLEEAKSVIEQGPPESR